MSLIINYIADLAPWIYGLCGLSALVYLYRVRNIRAERLQAIFALERERAAQAMAGIMTGVVGLLLVMGLTYMVSNVLDTAIKAEAGLDLPAEVGAESGSGSVLGTDTSLSPADETTGAGQAAIQPDLRNVPFCEDESALLSSPAVDDELAGTVAIQGTAAHDELASYDISIAPGSNPADQDFTSLGRTYNNVRGGLLWEFDTSNIGLGGPYTLRLSVLDTDDAVLADCSVAVRIVN